MQIRRHLTPRYVRSRLLQMARQWLRPHEPWLPVRAIRLLDSYLDKSHTVFEWGSGWSTVWFGEHVRQVVSVEHDREWFEVVQARLKKRGLGHKVTVSLVGDMESYACAIDQWQGMFDLILVDGRLRSECMAKAIGRVREGGILVLDNVERYLPSASRSPVAVREYVTGQWRQISEAIKDWGQEWVTDGVSDTLLLRCPRMSSNAV